MLWRYNISYPGIILARQAPMKLCCLFIFLLHVQVGVSTCVLQLLAILKLGCMRQHATLWK